MNKKLSALLTTAIVTGLLTAQSAKAEDKATPTSGDQMGDKDKCNGKKGEGGNEANCGGKNGEMKKKVKGKKGSKEACKSECGGKNGEGEMPKK